MTTEPAAGGGEKAAKEKADFFEELREQLRYWPYTIHQIDDTLDMSLIEGKGKQLLFQAINSRNLTTFIGSGFSASFGRLSWREWQDVQIDAVWRTAECFEKLVEQSRSTLARSLYIVDPDLDPKAFEAGALLPNGTSDTSDDLKRLRLRIYPSGSAAGSDPKTTTQINDFTVGDARNVARWVVSRQRQVNHAHADVTRLKRTFELTKSDSGSFPGGESLPILFEIAQQLHDLLQRQAILFLHKRDITPKDKKEILARNALGCLHDADNAAPVDSLKILTPVLCATVANSKSAYKKLYGTFRASLTDYYRQARKAETQMSFSDLVKMLLVDETAHAEHSLLRGFCYDWESGRRDPRGDRKKRVDEMRRTLDVLNTEKLSRRIPGIRQKPERYHVLTPFRCRNIRKIIEALPSEAAGWQGIAGFITANLRDQAADPGQMSGHEHTFLTPSSRFLAGMFLALLKDPIERLKETNPNAGLPQLTIFDEVKPADFRSRRSVVSERFDPLVKTARKLKISRFLTTNYDFEIERYFQDAGYRRFEHESRDGPSDGSPFPRGYMDLRSHRADSLGGVFRDLTFRRETASDLVSFTVSDEGVDASVFHLHGRASRDEEIVVTEADYMDLYLRRDAMREMVDEGISVAFSGAPILFLGLGMTEADLLRPLRQFISDRDREVGYTSIVLLPAEKDEDARAKASTALYLRYGVHTIFFGGGQVSIDGTPQDLDWLHKTLTLIGTLKAIAKDRRDALKRWTRGRRPTPEKEPYPRNLKTDTGKNLDDRTTLFKRLEDDLGKLVHNGREQTVLATLFGRKKLEEDDLFPVETHSNLRARLVCPIFTPVRHKTSKAARDARARHGDEKVDGTPYLDFYLQLLTHVTRQVVMGPPANAKLGTVLRDFTAQEIALEGLYGALLTGSLNASLEGLEKEWRSWWERWQQSPPHRLAKFERMAADTSLGDEFAEQNLVLPRRFIRYRVDSVITDMTKAESRVADAWPDQKAIAGPEKLANDINKLNVTGVRAADTFLRAVYLQRCKDETGGLLRPGRRFYTIAAHRGLGKGCLLSMMSTALGLSAYMRAAWPENGLLPPNSETPIVPAYFGAIFINLSFSTEIASVYDMLIDALEELARDVRRTCEELANVGSDPEELRKRLRKILHDEADPAADHGSRAGKPAPARTDLQRTLHLRQALAAFGQASGTFLRSPKNTLGLQPRVLVYINGIELLIERNGRAKNAEINDILAFLMSEEARQLPIDVIATGAETGLGNLWREPAPGPKGRMRASPDRPPEPALHPIRIDRPAMNARGQESVQQRAVASGIPFTSSDRQATSDQTNLVHFARPMKTTNFLIDNFFLLATALFVLHTHRHDAKTEEQLKSLADLQATTALQEALAGRNTAWSQPDPDKLAEELAANWGNIEIAVAECVISNPCLASNPTKIGEEAANQLKEILINRYISATDPSERQWQEIRRHLGANRLCMTLLLAAAQRIVLREKTLLEGAEKAEAFIFNTVNEIRNVSVEQREQTVLQAALDAYARFHTIGDPENDIELHQKLLRSLAVIGSPVSANVLVRLPDIRAYFRNAKTEFNVSRRRTVSRALHTLALRGLCFRLHPHPQVNRPQKSSSTAQEETKRPGDWPPRLEYRFALHRIVQHYGISKLGSGTADPIAINSFSPSLYASMPAGLPRLTHEAYEYLRGLLVGLSQYPDIPHTEQRFEPWIFSTDNHTTRVEALRAALTMVRSTFSISVVSRFEDYKSLPASRAARKRGYFETYKVRLRWIIRKAWELLEVDDLRTATAGAVGKDPDPAADLETGFRAYRPDLDWPKMNALYRDEIVWLYNEAGLTCLVQGNLTDAVALLRQAIELNRGIDGREDTGRQHNRISLNLAIVQIERGRLTAAQKRLHQIQDSETARRDRVFKLATGYLGLIDHLMGNIDKAERRYNEAIKWCREDDDVRGAAVFLNHKARLTAARDPEQTLLLLGEARQFADTGGHEDVRRHIVLSEIRTRMLTPVKERPRAEVAMQRLREVEDYADLMGAPSLACEALHLRARILLENGEASTAGKLLARAIAIARRNAMNLRLNSAMTTYALSLLHRGRPLPAERLLYASLEMAKRARYNREITRVLRELEGPEFLDGKHSHGG
ncbi:SIR2 family protein [Stappia sp. MMSF_3263]|uniref:SIR2 family protein n=1 Tax=Stappia sp. MMSF_3263 TaxID=3046693 RepID=UPI00273E247A|nr:SIR2 family protein [Stappia sp. MMSF_3263]